MSKGKSLVSVKVIKGDINRALKKFKRGVMESEHLQELRERQTYTKPKTVRRKQKQQAIREQEKLTMLEKIENGDTKIRLFTKKRKKKKGPNPQNKNKSTQK
jgi:ribosomal protein S21